MQSGVWKEAGNAVEEAEVEKEGVLILKTYSNGSLENGLNVNKTGGEDKSLVVIKDV